MRKLVLLFAILLSVNILYGQNNGRLLYSSIYTETGYGYDENRNPLNSGISYSYYVKIYEKILVVTTVQFGTGQTIDLKYPYKGKSNPSTRIYGDNNYMVTDYIVDDKYNIIKVLTSPSMMYGDNVKIRSFWNLVKGEKYQQYNRMHDEDGSSYESKYLRNTNPFIF